MRRRVQLLLRCLILVACIATPRASTAQGAIFSGVVLTDDTEKPIVGVEVILTALNRTTRSDSVGNFLFSGLPAGRQRVLVRFPGYESITTDVTFVEGKPLEIDLLLKPTSTKLAAVEVNATATRYAIKLADFEQRRSQKTGRFITADVFEKHITRPVSSILLENIPGIKAIHVNGRAWLANTRGGKGFGCSPTQCTGLEKVPPGCYLQIRVNGLVRWNGPPNEMFDVDALPANEIIGVEYYTIANAPAQFAGLQGNPCGIVLFWTKS